MAAGAASVATWRNEAGDVLAYTYGGTCCWFPRLPGRLRIEHEDFAHIIRCKGCPGCRELERRRLADRLVEKYRGQAGAMWLVRIYTSPARAGRLSNKLHRKRYLELEAGFCRLGPGSFGMLTTARPAVHTWLAKHGLKHRFDRVRLSRGRRAFSAWTAGLLIDREKYGDDLNRWYIRGLPKIHKERFEVVKREYEKGYSRPRSPRAWKSGRVVLVPPEWWLAARATRRSLRTALSRVSSPEDLGQVQLLARRFGEERALLSSVQSPGFALPSREAIRQFYATMKANKERRAREGSTDNSSPSPALRGGYNTSGHSSWADEVAEIARKRDQARLERIRGRAPDSWQAGLERMMTKWEAREGRAIPEVRAEVAKALRKEPK